MNAKKKKSGKREVSAEKQARAEKKTGAGKDAGVMREADAREEVRPLRERIPGIITGIWVVLMLVVFPIVYDDYYFNILETKFTVYCFFAFGLFALMAVWWILSLRIVRGPASWIRGMRQEGLLCWFRRNWSGTDVCMLGFCLISVISTLGAGPYIHQAFTGEEGRFVGLLYIMILTAAYFIVSRNLRFRSVYVTLFLLAALFVCLFGITDFFNMNLLHFRDRMDETQFHMFMSTIGNINTYTVFVGITCALSGTLFVLSGEGLLRTLFYYLTAAVAMTALVMGNSDNGYLTMLALLGFLPLAAFGTYRGIRRYALLTATFFSGLLFAGREVRVLGDGVIGLEGISHLLVESGKLPGITALLWVLTAALFALELRNRNASLKAGGGPDFRKPPALLKKIWAGLLIASAAVVLVLFLGANSVSAEEASQKYGSLASYLRFSDSWGTNRGYIWRACVEEYRELPLRQKLFGTGPDTFGIYMALLRWNEMHQITGQYYDAAHNEYLNYLFTVGPFGLLFFAGALGFAIRDALRGAGKIAAGLVPEFRAELAPYLSAFAFLILCYAAQAVVNINIPIATPVMWTFLMIAEKMIRTVRKSAEQRK